MNPMHSALVVFGIISVISTARASVVQPANANFEAPVLSAASAAAQDVSGWFDIAGTGSGSGDVVQFESPTGVTDLPPDTDGSNWLLLADPTTAGDKGVYQTVGTHDTGVIAYDISYLVGRRGNNVFNEMIVEMYYGSATGAEGTDIDTLGLTLIGTAPIGIGGLGTSGAASESRTSQISAVGVPGGQTLWLAFRGTDDSTVGTQQGLLDDVSVAAVVPEPASLAAVAILGSALARRRQRRGA
jgi:hypothetical protein